MLPAPLSNAWISRALGTAFGEYPIIPPGTAPVGETPRPEAVCAIEAAEGPDVARVGLPRFPFFLFSDLALPLSAFFLVLFLTLIDDCSSL